MSRESRFFLALCSFVWEQREFLNSLEKVIDFRGRTPKKLGCEWSEEGFLALSALNVKDGYIDKNIEANFGDGTLYTLWMAGNELHKGQVLFTTEAPMGNVAQVPDNQRYILSQRTIAFQVNNKKWIEDFLAVCIKSPEVFKELEAMSSGGTAKGISQKSLSELKVIVPNNTTEQTAIGTFFATLDNLITCHQRKRVCLYAHQKQCFIVKIPIFPNTWEQRELGKVAEKIVEKNVNLEYSETFTNSAEFGIVSQRDFFDHDISNVDNINTYYVVKNEDFIYNPRISTFAPVGPINRNKLGRNGVMSPLYTVFRPKNLDNSFLEQFFKSNGWHSFMLLNGDTGARSDRLAIKDNMFFQMPIPHPQIEEQTSIGTFFATLDNLITCHQRKPIKIRRKLC